MGAVALRAPSLVVALGAGVVAAAGTVLADRAATRLAPSGDEWSGDGSSGDGSSGDGSSGDGLSRHGPSGDGSSRHGPSRLPGWRRTNYRGRSVTLAGGVAAATGATLAAVTAAPVGWRCAAAIVGSSAAFAGGYDDLIAPRLEQAGDKGWRGHLAGLRAGRPTGGVVKVAVIGTGAVVAARLVSRSWAAATPVAVLVAGTANLVNLFDLRPGRAGKVVTLLALGQVRGPHAAIAGAVAGAALAELPGDLAETRMLGDIGANALGALLGLRLAANTGPSRWAALVVVGALSAASERISFTQVIARYAPLRNVDEWGRRPADPPPAHRPE